MISEGDLLDAAAVGNRSVAGADYPE